jgi:hypothetical protein
MIRSRTRRPGRRRLATVALAVTAALSASSLTVTPCGGEGRCLPQPSVSHAAGTDPALILSAAQAFSASSGVTSVQITGAFNFEDVVQFSFPAGVLVFQGTRFARYDTSGAATSGTAAFLADGLSAAELETLLGSGSAAPAPAALLQLQPSRAVVALPAGFSAGSASVLVYAVLENTAFLSNTLGFTLPGS